MPTTRENAKENTMLTFIHSPNSRSTAILSLIEEMGIKGLITVREVTIPHIYGTGGAILPIRTRKARSRH